MLTPAIFRPGQNFRPEIGGYLTVTFPGEIMRCRVEREIDQDRAIVEIEAVPMSKTHLYRKGDKVGVQRRVENGQDIWEALDDRDFIAGRSPNVPPPPPAVVEPEKPKRKRKAA